VKIFFLSVPVIFVILFDFMSPAAGLCRAALRMGRPTGLPLVPKLGTSPAAQRGRRWRPPHRIETRRSRGHLSLSTCRAPMTGDFLDRARGRPLAAGPSSTRFLCWRVLGNWARQSPAVVAACPKMGAVVDRAEGPRQVRSGPLARCGPRPADDARDGAAARARQYIATRPRPVKTPRRRTLGFSAIHWLAGSVSDICDLYVYV